MRRSLGTQLALLAIAVAVVTAIVAGVLAVGLVRQGASGEAQRQLGRLADAAATRADNAVSARAGQVAVRRVLRTLGVQSAVLNPRGRLIGDPVIGEALAPADLTALEQGRSLSLRRDVAGHAVYVEARPTDAGGGVVLVQKRSEALAAGGRATRWMLLALLIGLAVAVPGGLLLGRRLARPLQHTAAAARELSGGRRDVRAPVEGPAEVAEVATAINSLAVSLERSEARQRAFLLSVSHDLRTPLTSLIGYSESLASGIIPASEVAEVGAVMGAEAERMKRLVQDLLDLARLQSDQLRLDLAETDLPALLAATARVWSRRCGSAGVDFRSSSTVRGSVTTDPARLRQVLDGLLENALRLTPAGLPVVLSAHDEGDQVVLEVRDGGPGLTTEDVADAFRPGVLYDRYRGVRPVGTGLGLAIVRQLAGRLGGTVQAGHAAEGGARFAVRLPRGGPTT